MFMTTAILRYYNNGIKIIYSQDIWLLIIYGDTLGTLCSLPSQECIWQSNVPLTLGLLIDKRIE